MMLYVLIQRDIARKIMIIICIREPIKTNRIIYLATVEVKSPFGSEAIYKKDFSNYYQSWYEKIGQHLAAKKIDKVIFTDTFKWEFYKENLDSHKEIVLVDRIQKGRGYTYKWKDDAETEFNNLKKKLEEFLKH